MRRTRTIRAWLALLCLGWLVAASAQVGAARADAAAAPIMLGDEHEAIALIARSRFWIDEARHATPDALEAAGDSIPWRLREADQTYRIDGTALWFEFDAINRGFERWFIELGSSGIDRAQFFYRDAQGHWVTEEAGDSQPVSQWPLPGRLPTFELSGPVGKPVRYWLRIEHSRVDFASPLVIYDQSTLFASREREQFLLGGYFSIAALIAVVSLANGIAFRDRNFTLYAVYVAALAVGQMAYLGVGAQHVWDKWLRWNELATFVLPGISAAAGLWFTRSVTEPARFSRALDLSMWGLMAALLSSVALDALLVTRASFLLQITMTSLSLVVIVALLAAAWLHGEDPYIRVISVGFLPVLVMAIFPIARAFGLIPVSALTRYGVSIGAALEMPILFYALSLRGGRRREAQVRASALSRNDALTGLAHTRTFLQRLETALQRCGALRHACALLVVKIANYNAIVAEYGRDTAERSLVVAASRLRAVTTDIDMAARVGDHIFALLIEGPTTTEQVTSRAQALVASGLRETDALPNGLVLKFQVALAMLPDRQLDADGALAWLQEAANAVPSDSRKLIRPLNF
ncbi:MAG TPA: 7TM diverse intracellular signaling domain-containing protein [Ramlibacter sp.]|nr:7TM diverse intracellular signaling domain-containing protein [Ramlibacter sp.]